MMTPLCLAVTLLSHSAIAPLHGTRCLTILIWMPTSLLLEALKEMIHLIQMLLYLLGIQKESHPTTALVGMLALL